MTTAKKNWGEGASLLKAVAHFDPDVVFLGENRPGFDIRIESTYYV